MEQFSSSDRLCQLYRFGTVPFDTMWALQQKFLKERKAGNWTQDSLFLVEHPPVYTLGQGANPQFLRFDPATSSVPVFRIERGGEVTYHCPGQLVGYPILNLKEYRTDLHWYLRQLEEVLIQTLAELGLKARRFEGLTGVWIGNTKVAAIGIKVSRWITMHGFALNICPDLSGFQKIVPCGISHKPVGSLQQFLPEITRTQVSPLLETAFESVFEVQLSVSSQDSLPEYEQKNQLVREVQMIEANRDKIIDGTWMNLG